ncbi:hypothetical protein KAJ83_12925 [Marivibrio halodurans]|uniref:Uncharacterized protein n=1 Tax=Marivibrio halodurans TaxID=2039722 RepID=A0A8J7S090_9PROT|nr:hypothetical protein [Marivibrio halodurans]MBP5857915.1 hypothetical protein [Marivibrio halodurans]
MGAFGERGAQARLRKAEVRNASVLELMLIIIFVALLMLGGAMTRLTEYEGQVEDLQSEGASREALEKRLAGAAARIGELRAQMLDLRRQLALMRDKGEEVGETLVAIDRIKEQLEGYGGGTPVETLADVEAAVTRLVRDMDAAKSARAASDDLVAEVARLEAEMSARRARAESLEQAVSRVAQSLNVPLDTPVGDVLRRVEDEVGALRSDLTSARDRVSAMEAAEQERLRKVRGYVPCWVDARDNPEFTYDVTIADYRWIVEPGWPAHRADDVRALDILHIPRNNSLTLEQWRDFAAPIYDHGRAREDDCRFRVRLYDRTTTKESYQAGLRWAERYFIAAKRSR